MAGSGIPYFPLNCQLDEKFELIEAEFGLKGFAVVVKLLQRIYGEHGYYCEWTKEVELLFSRRLGFPVGDNSVSEIVESAVRREIFSSDLFNQYRILTSKGIQQRYFDAVSRRKKVELKGEYLLVPATHFPNTVDILSGNVCRNNKNADIFEQRKEEKRKGKKRKENSGGELFRIFEECGFQITAHAAEELQALSEECSEAWVIEAIRRAADHGKRTLAYVKGILRNWQIAGAMDSPKKLETQRTYECDEEESL